jgi:hypothetical protein
MAVGFVAGLLLISTGARKATNIPKVTADLSSLLGLSRKVGLPLAGCLAVTEIALGFTLLFSLGAIGLASATALFLTFALVSAGSLAVGKRGAPCGCGTGSGRLSFEHVTSNSALAILCAAGLGPTPWLAASGLSVFVLPRIWTATSKFARSGRPVRISLPTS